MLITKLIALFIPNTDNYFLSGITLSGFHCITLFPPKLGIIYLSVETDLSPVLSKSRHTLKMMVSDLSVEFEITVYHIHNIILNTVTMRT